MRTIRKMQIGISIESDQTDAEKEKQEKEKQDNQAAAEDDAAAAAVAEAAATDTPTEAVVTEGGETAEATAEVTPEAAAAETTEVTESTATPETTEVTETTTETPEAGTTTEDTVVTDEVSATGEVSPVVSDAPVEAEAMAAEVGGVTPEGTTPVGEDPAAAAAAAATATIADVAENGATGEPTTELAQQLEDTRTKVEQLAELAAETSTGLIEVERLATQLDVEADVAESRVDAVDALDATADFVEERIEEGGLSAGEAEAVNIAVEQIMNSVRMPAAARKPLPSMENFGLHSDKLQTTRQSLEAIQINAQTLRNALVAAWKRIKELAIKYWNAIFNNIPQLEQRANKLEELVKGLNASGATTLIDNERIARELSLGDVVPGDLAGSLRHLKEIITPVFSLQQDTIGVAESFLKQVNTNGPLAGIYENFALDTWGGLSHIKVVDTEDGINTYETDNLIGNFKIFYHAPAEALRGPAAVKAIKDGISSGVIDSDDEGAESVRGLNQQSAVAVLHELKGILAVLKAYKPQQAHADKVKAELISVSARLNPDALDERDLGAVRDILIGLQGFVDQPATSVSRRTLSVVKAGLDLVDVSVKQETSGKNAGAKETKPAGALTA